MDPTLIRLRLALDGDMTIMKIIVFLVRTIYSVCYRAHCAYKILAALLPTSTTCLTSYNKRTSDHALSETKNLEKCKQNLPKRIKAIKTAMSSR